MKKIVSPSPDNGGRSFVPVTFESLLSRVQPSTGPSVGFGGGAFGGSGASSSWSVDINVPGPYDYVENIPLLDGMTFSDAYSAARRAGLGEFEFNGRMYSTDYDPNATLGPVQMGESLVGNLRNVYDADGRIIRDSTRVEPWMGQIPGRHKREHAQGGTLLLPYNKFEMGGPEGEGEGEGEGEESQYQIGLENYLAAQADKMRVAAHEKSANRTLPRVPIMGYKNYTDPKTGEMIRVPDYGLSCIYTALDNYGEPYLVSGNEQFMGNPEKYGFKQISLSELLPGDIVQSGGVGYGGIYYPSHGMIFDGYDDEGFPLFNYSNGTINPNDSGGIKIHKRYPVYTETGPDYTISDQYNRAYRFVVGTQEDQARWRDEYKDKYGIHNTPLGHALVPPSMLLEVPHTGLAQK